MSQQSCCKLWYGVVNKRKGHFQKKARSLWLEHEMKAIDTNKPNKKVIDKGKTALTLSAPSPSKEKNYNQN